MEKILSQEEINALFSAMSSEDLGLASSADKSVASRRISNYDFHRADRISQDQMRSLNLLHDYFGRNFSSSLSAYLRAFVDVNLISVDQVSYAEFLKLLPDSTLIANLGMRPLDSNLAIELNPSLVFPMIDMLLGGSGTPSMGDRNMTEIEMNIIEGVIRLAMRDLKEAWRPIMDLEFYLEGSGTKPHMFQLVAPGETVVAVGLEMKLGENSGMMNICIPSRLLKVIRSRFDQQWTIRRQKVAGNDAERIISLIRPAELKLNAEMRNSSLTMDALLKVSVGDVLALEQRIGDPLVLCVCGIPKYLGRIVAHRGKRAFEITEQYIS